MNSITKDEAVEIATRYGVTGTELAKAWGHTRQWLYSPRKTKLPAVYRWALLPTLEAIGNPPKEHEHHHTTRHLHITIEEED